METKFCQNCGEKINEKAEICVKCGVRVKEIIKKKDPILAAILSFLIIGAGQIYNGETSKGILLMLSAIISWFLMFVIIGFIIYPVLLIYAIYDAYKGAEKINNN
jgi:TM2 domain-containing membrane protein YozV